MPRRGLSLLVLARGCCFADFLLAVVARSLSECAACALGVPAVAEVVVIVVVVVVAG